MAVRAGNFNDEYGMPAGGYAWGPGFRIEWQNGPLVVNGERRDQSGAFVEHVLEAALQRIQYYQSGKFSCRQNALAITKIEEALHWLHDRTAERERRGVEGTHTP